MSVIEDVKQKTDIVDIINQYTTLAKAGRTMRALCPFHSEKSPSFFVYPEQQSWHCFGACNTGGDVFSFIMKKQGVDFGEALRFLAERAGVTLTSNFESDKKREETQRLYQANAYAAQYFHDSLGTTAGEKARSYLAGRGLSAKAIDDFQLGFAPNGWENLKQYLIDKGFTEKELVEVGLLIQADDGKTHDRFRNRLMFPIKDARGNITGFGARVLDDSLPKYTNSPQTPIFDKSGTIYGINLAAAAIRQQDRAVIVEGYMDVIAAHQYGFSNVIATMGTSVTEKQVGTLKKLSRNIVLALDSDAAGEEAMLRCVGYENSLDTEVRVLILPKGKDPDEVIKEDAKTWQQLLDNALPAVDYTINMVTAKLDLATARDKSLAVEQLMPVVAGIKDVVRRAHYLQKLAGLVKVSEHSLEAALKKPQIGKTKQGKETQAPSQTLRPFLSSPIEEYCLTLLLKHPDLKMRDEGLLAEYFENSENREIFIAWREDSDLESLKTRLDMNLWEHVDGIIGREIVASRVEDKFVSCILRLREKYLRSLEAKKAAILALEAEAGGTVAELAKLMEQGTEVSVKLGEVFQARRGKQRR